MAAPSSSIRSITARALSDTFWNMYLYGDLRAVSVSWKPMTTSPLPLVEQEGMPLSLRVQTTLPLFFLWLYFTAGVLDKNPFSGAGERRGVCAAEAVLEEAGVMGVAPLWVGLDLGAGVVGVVCSAVLFCPFILALSSGVAYAPMMSFSSSSKSKLTLSLVYMRGVEVLETVRREEGVRCR